MKSRLILIAAVLSLSTAAMAQSNSADHSGHHPQPAASSAPTSQPSTEGEVRRIDLSQGKVTLRHGRIDNLDMPPMTMVFTAADPKVLNRLKVGDKVRFYAEKKNGTFTVTAIELID